MHNAVHTATLRQREAANPKPMGRLTDKRGGDVDVSEKVSEWKVEAEGKWANQM